MISISKKLMHLTVQYVLSNTNILILTARGLARKVQELVLSLNLTQEPKNAMRPREVRLQKEPRVMVKWWLSGVYVVAKWWICGGDVVAMW